MKEYKLSQLLEIKNGKDHKELPNGDYPVFGSGGVMRYVNEYLYDKPSILLPRKGSLNNIQYCDVPFGLLTHYIIPKSMKKLLVHITYIIIYAFWI